MGKNRPHSRCSAFTLIEILVVVAIIALLVAILLPALAKAKDQARRAACASNLHQMGLACMHYAGAHKGVGPFRGWKSYTISEVEHEAGVPPGRRDVKTLVNYGLLYGKWMTKSFEVMYCPSDYELRDAPHHSRGETWGGMSTVWNGRTYWTFGSYNYGLPLMSRGPHGNDPVGPILSGTNPYPQELWSTGMAEWVAAKEQELGIPAGSFKVPPVCVMMADRVIGGWARHGTGINVSYTDGHVRFHSMKNPELNSASIGQYELWYRLSVRP